MLQESFNSLRVPGKKSDRLAIAHGGSVVTRFIPQKKLIFPSKSRVSTDYHGEINLDVLGSFYTSAQNAAFETLAVKRFYVLSTQ